VFLAVQTLTPLFSLTVPNFVVLFYVRDRLFNEDAKNVFKIVIFSLQVCLISNFLPEYKLCSKVAKIRV